uniref:Uncharacterized protein n=1 Tax=Strigops habroptila TaxID=2489341 RepID=A0A672TH30_STRHB
MAMAEASEELLHRLAGTSPGAKADGLVLRQGSAAAEQHKQQERKEEAAGGKRPRVSSYKDWEEGRDEEFWERSQQRKGSIRTMVSLPPPRRRRSERRNAVGIGTMIVNRTW